MKRSSSKISASKPPSRPHLSRASPGEVKRTRSFHFLPDAISISTDGHSESTFSTPSDYTHNQSLGSDVFEVESSGSSESDADTYRGNSTNLLAVHEQVVVVDNLGTAKTTAEIFAAATNEQKAINEPSSVQAPKLSIEDLRRMESQSTASYAFEDEDNPFFWSMETPEELNELQRARAALDRELERKYSIAPQPTTIVRGSSTYVPGHPYWGLEPSARYEHLDQRYRAAVDTALPNAFFDVSDIPPTQAAKSRQVRIHSEQEESSYKPRVRRQSIGGALLQALYGTTRDQLEATETLQQPEDSEQPQQLSSPAASRRSSAISAKSTSRTPAVVESSPPVTSKRGFLTTVGGAVQLSARPKPIRKNATNRTPSKSPS